MRLAPVGRRAFVKLKGGPYGGRTIKLGGQRSLSISVQGFSGFYYMGDWHESCPCRVCS
uniref:DUF4236 domain-containing protein n=1 Tax=Pseudomonas phage Cygsa01 TaxID=3138529 RepID=A0AAU6W413_9VIRU